MQTLELITCMNNSNRNVLQVIGQRFCSTSDTFLISKNVMLKCHQNVKRRNYEGTK